MNLVSIAHLLLLLAVANGGPVIAKRILGPRFAVPVDFNHCFIDGRPLFGPTKTIRGFVSSIALTSIVAELTAVAWWIGALIALAAMVGDLLSSFIKRRLGMAPSAMAIGLDQIPEALFPALAASRPMSLTSLDVTVTIVLFLVGELIVSRALYSLGIRDRPY